MNKITTIQNDYTEDLLVEVPTIHLFKKMGWETINAFEEVMGKDGTLGRDTQDDVVLEKYLYPMLKKLNDKLCEAAITEAIGILKKDLSSLSIVKANQEIYKLLKDGVIVDFIDDEGNRKTENVRVIDWQEPENNNFLLVSQLWIQGKIYRKRADLIGFINGIPLVFIELKATHKDVANAFNVNYSEYKETIPHIFWYNGVVILSNGSKAKIGSITSEWEHFFDWDKITEKGEHGIIPIETAVKGLCDKKRLIDYIENFTLFHDTKDGLTKIVAKNHQYLGVNSSIESFNDREKNKGKIGVFWHTQGSGKTFSMIFFSNKIHRTLPGNWTFLVITDRQDLDRQAYKNFANSYVLTEPEKDVHADSCEHLKELLTHDHRYIFTLIHKFREPKVISERDNIVVLVDEAHRDQYDTLALNMRMSIPNASYIAFTGTPLIASEEKTKEVFGDYVSIYNFKQSISDGATVGLHYENRIPELQINENDLNDRIENLLEEAEITPEQEEKLEREFSQQYHLITREERLDKIAQDIVVHFVNRGFAGKAMVISVDKATTLKMYEKVKDQWQLYLNGLRQGTVEKNTSRELIDEKIKYMEETDMAVVVSQSMNEVSGMKSRGLDITKHRERMMKEDLEKKFKDSGDPFRIVFVCAMWITGFDVPSCSTIYLDKPMKNHTLMQTIARANRVYKAKKFGLIVDYIGVFRNLKKALAIYGTDPTGKLSPDETPVLNKEDVIRELEKQIKDAELFCNEQSISIDEIIKAEPYQKILLLDTAVEVLLERNEIKDAFIERTNIVYKLFKAILPDTRASQYYQQVKTLMVLAEKIKNNKPYVDITEIMEKIERLLDETISTVDYTIKTPEPIDLSKIDFDKLKAMFEKGKKKQTADALQKMLEQRIENMIAVNKTRIDFMNKLKEMIEEYNTGSHNIESLFEELVKLTNALDDEEKRTIKENLTEEELAIFDLLTKPEMSLKESEKKKVKAIAQKLINKLNEEKLLAIDWKKKQEMRARVMTTIQDILDELPEEYNRVIYKTKCDRVFDHIYSSYAGEGQSVYSSLSTDDGY